MKISVDCPGGDIVISTRAELSLGTVLDIFGRSDVKPAQPINISGWVFVLVPVGYTGSIDHINDLTAPIIVTWSLDAVEAIAEFDSAGYSTVSVTPYLTITPGPAIWECDNLSRPPRLLTRPIQTKEFNFTKKQISAIFKIARGVNYIDSRAIGILGDILPSENKTQKWLAGKSITWSSVVAEHVDASALNAVAARLAEITEQLARAGGGGKSITEREALLNKRDIFITALESYDKEICAIRIPETLQSAVIATALITAPVPKPTAPQPAPFNMDVAAANARLAEINAILAAPAPIISPVPVAPRLINLAEFDPAARAAAEKYNTILSAEIARIEERAAEAKKARAEHAKRINLEAEAAKIKHGIANLQLLKQWERYKEWKKTAGVTAQDFEKAARAEREAEKLTNLIRLRAEVLQQLLEIERAIGANRSEISPDEYRNLYTMYFNASNEYKEAQKAYKAHPIFREFDLQPEDTHARRIIALAGFTQIEYALLKIAPSAEILRELTAIIPYIFIVDYRAADWFLPTRETPTGIYVGRLVPLPAPIPQTCACGKTYKNYRKHIDSAAHKKWSMST